MASIIDEIKNQVDIIDVVQEYVDLSKKGRNYWGVCPFHDDSNPSMSVSPEKQMYNCFSCGKAGGIFKFVQDIEKISFKEAMKKLGSRVGIEVNLNDEVARYTEIQDKLISALKDAMDYYQLSIDTQEGEHALKYAEERGLSALIRERFNIGYAPKNRLVNFLVNKKGHDESILINASLMNSMGNDFFQDRLIFGISNEWGDIVALSGRTLNNEQAKYINSSESLIFKKSQTLYNWHNAKSEASRKKEVIVVEGFMDVIALYKAGYENVVAIMGTALTKENISKISDLEVTLMLDSDGAGISATIKSIKLLLENNIKVSVIKNGEKDPDEIFKSEGKEGIEKTISNKITALEYIYDIHKLKYSVDSSSEVQEFVESFKKYLMNGTDIEKDFFANKIEKELGISKDVSLHGIKNEKKKEWVSREEWIANRESNKNIKKVEKTNSDDINFNKHSYTLIRSLLNSRVLSEYYETRRHDVNFIDKVLITLSSYIVKAQKGEVKIPMEYKQYIEDNIKLDGEKVTTPEELDDLINTINFTYKRYVRKQNNVKLENKDGING